MATFYNKATLSFGGETINSNTTEAELLIGLELTKTAFNTSYTPGGNIVYSITLQNNSSTPYNALTLYDNLGAYEYEGATLVPLDYVDGSIYYYLNGILQATPTVNTDNGLQIIGIDIPAGATATFIYETRANEFAPLAGGLSITNTASTDGGTGVGVRTASETVPVRNSVELTIAKAVCPAVVTDNAVLTYTIIVQNLGNTAVLATDGVIVSDVFNPALGGITVSLNGTPLLEGTGYTYNEATGEFSTVNGAISVDAASYTRDSVSGAVITTPGVAVLTISGTV